MSLEADNLIDVPLCLITNRKAPRTAITLYCFLKSRGSDGPSYAEIHERTGMATSSISRTIKWLEENGYLKYERGKPYGIVNRYEFTDERHS